MVHKPQVEWSTVYVMTTQLIDSARTWRGYPGKASWWLNFTFSTKSSCQWGTYLIFRWLKFIPNWYRISHSKLTLSFSIKPNDTLPVKVISCTFLLCQPSVLSRLSARALFLDQQREFSGLPHRERLRIDPGGYYRVVSYFHSNHFCATQLTDSVQ